MREWGKFRVFPAVKLGEAPQIDQELAAGLLREREIVTLPNGLAKSRIEKTEGEDSHCFSCVAVG